MSSGGPGVVKLPHPVPDEQTERRAIEQAAERFRTVVAWWQERMKLRDIEIDLIVVTGHEEKTGYRFNICRANGGDNWSRARMTCDKNVLLRDAFKELFESAAHELIHVLQWPFNRLDVDDDALGKAMEEQAYKLEQVFLKNCPADEELIENWQRSGGRVD